MIVEVKVKTGSKQRKIEKQNNGSYKVWVKNLPRRGEANAELIEIFSNYFNIDKKGVKILRGFHSSKKLIEIKE